MDGHVTRIAILIVNGGSNPKQGRWIDLCLAKLQQFTPPGLSQVYLWNNSLNDLALRKRLRNLPGVTYLEAAPYERLVHPHAVPLQRLYTLARAQDAEIIVTLDSDAHPIRPGWLTELTSALANGAVLAGVWRDELSNGIAPYVHPSCLVTTVDSIERHQLRFDRLPSTDGGEQSDTLSHFTKTLQAAGLPIYPLRRSNTNNIHRLIGGIYGDLIYHHGAGARNQIDFWDEAKSTGCSECHIRLRDQAAEWLFTDYQRYLNWLRGFDPENLFAGKALVLAQSTLPGRIEPKAMPGSISAKILNLARSPRQRIRTIVKKTPGARLLANRLGLTHRPATALTDAKILMLRPPGPADLYDLPAGWRVTGPAFIGVGAPKCGTSWWYKLLVDHPQVVINRCKFTRSKELQYFPHFQSRPLSETQIDLYRQFFAAPPGAICGELSTQYLGYPACLEHLGQAQPNAKILVMVRNPIDRMLSHLNHTLTHRARWFPRFDRNRFQLIKQWPLYCEVALHSLYAVGLRRLFRYFDHSQVLVLQYERCRQNPAVELARTYRFLGLNDHYLPSGLEHEVNVLPYLIPYYTPEERAHLAAYFSDDIRQTVELCPEIDLTLWADFAGS